MGLDGGINRADWEHPADRMRWSNAGVPVEESPGLLVAAARLRLNSSTVTG